MNLIWFPTFLAENHGMLAHVSLSRIYRRRFGFKFVVRNFCLTDRAEVVDEGVFSPALVMALFFSIFDVPAYTLHAVLSHVPANETDL